MEKPAKRKEPSSASAGQKNSNNGPLSRKRVRIQDARAIMAQTSYAGLSNGELDLQAFMRAREFEIGALEDAMKRSKSALTTRAFQQVPRELRRRTASHNVKRVPKRLRRRAAREMKDDNTPTVTSRRRKPGTSRGRIRAETAKRLGLLAAKKRVIKDETMKKMGIDVDAIDMRIRPRTARPKKKHGKLEKPPNTGTPFRRRQIHKTWLPTHIWHAKRAEMTPPKHPLWRFALPLRPTAKAYRISHKASALAGALCWDTSYMSTIGLEGTEENIKTVLSEIGVGASNDDAWSVKGQKWRCGKRSWKCWASVADETGVEERRQIGPMTVIWCGDALTGKEDVMEDTQNPKKRKVFIRLHPSIFLEIWTEVLKISRRLRPLVAVHDLRFDIGSIELTGPGSTEALLAVLHPFVRNSEPLEPHAETFKSLKGISNPSILPQNALLHFSILDPRLRYPPRRVNLPRADDEAANIKLLEMVASWPLDETDTAAAMFDPAARWSASRLPSQKTINKRKSIAAPGEYPEVRPTDAPIPIMLLTTRADSSSSAQGTWTLLGPWKCILPIWHLLMHVPLSTGANPRFGGQNQLDQISFERREPRFPDDYPGSTAGWQRELVKRQDKKNYFDRRPPGKKVNFSTLDLGLGRKGEVGLGWACDFELFTKDQKDREGDVEMTNGQKTHDSSEEASSIPPLYQLPSSAFVKLLRQPSLKLPGGCLATVRITTLSRGVFHRNARIYRLPIPSDSRPNGRTIQAEDHKISNSFEDSLRAQWLATQPLPATASTKAARRSKAKQQRLTALLQASDLPSHEKRRLLAQSLLESPLSTFPAAGAAAPLSATQAPGPDQAQTQTGGGGAATNTTTASTLAHPAIAIAAAYPTTPSAEYHPPVPDAADLMGFVTSGEFNLAEGRGSAIGNLYVPRALEAFRAAAARGKGREGRLCVLRNAGESVGRLAVWEAVGT